MDAIRENIKELYKRSEENKLQIERVEQKANTLYDLTTSVQLLSKEIANMREDTGEIKQQVSSINEDLVAFKLQGSMKWDKFMWWMFIFIIGAIANGVLTKIGG